MVFFSKCVANVFEGPFCHSGSSYSRRSGQQGRQGVLRSVQEERTFFRDDADDRILIEEPHDFRHAFADARDRVRTPHTALATRCCV